jgi:hypothetical protein
VVDDLNLNDDLKEIEADEDKDLQSKKPDVTFDGNFETGNFETAFESAPHVYDVWLRTDSSSRGLMWFNFRMRNQNNYTNKIRVRIVNIGTGEKNILQAVSRFQPCSRLWLI